MILQKNEAYYEFLKFLLHRIGGLTDISRTTVHFVKNGEMYLSATAVGAFSRLLLAE